MLTGAVRSPSDLPEGDMRKHMPRYQPGAFETNMKLVEEVEKIAKQKACTPAQLAIGWTRSLSKKDGNPEIIPIPGATTVERVSENSTDVTLSSEELKQINAVLEKCEVVGARYGVAQQAHLEG